MTRKARILRVSALLTGGGCAFLLLAFGQLFFSLIPLGVLLLTLIALSPNRKALVGTVGLALVITYFIVAAHYCSSGAQVHVVLKIAEPGRIDMIPSSSRGTASAKSGRFGLGGTTLALLANAEPHETQDPLLIWTGEPWGFVPFTSQTDSVRASTLVTCGPRRWIQGQGGHLLPFQFLSAEGSKSEQMSTAIRLRTGTTNNQDDTYLWQGQFDWSSDSDNCVCNYQDVESFAASCPQRIELVVRAGPVALIPATRETFWIEYARQDGSLEKVHLANLIAESPWTRYHTFDFDMECFDEEALANVDVWGEITTGSRHQVIVNRTINMEPSSFLLLGEGGELRIDGQIQASFDGPFFAIVESYRGHRSKLAASVPALTIVLPAGEWGCGCPLLWIFDQATYDRASGRVSVSGGIGELRVDDATYPFEEFDSISLIVEELSLSNRRTAPDEYVLAGKATAVEFNEQALVSVDLWAQIPKTIQQVVFAFLADTLSVGLGSVLAPSRRVRSPADDADT